MSVAGVGVGGGGGGRCKTLGTKHIDKKRKKYIGLYIYIYIIIIIIYFLEHRRPILTQEKPCKALHCLTVDIPPHNKLIAKFKCKLDSLLASYSS